MSNKYKRIRHGETIQIVSALPKRLIRLSKTGRRLRYHQTHWLVGIVSKSGVSSSVAITVLDVGRLKCQFVIESAKPHITGAWLPIPLLVIGPITAKADFFESKRGAVYLQFVVAQTWRWVGALHRKRKGE